MQQRALVLFLVFMLAGNLLSAQENQYVFNDVTTGLQPTSFSYNTIPYELRENKLHGNVVKIIETQDYHPNPSHDQTGYFLIERDKKYSKHIFYTTTPKTTTTFSYSSDGKISSIDQEIVETTFYRRIKTAVLLSTHDQQSSNRRRRHIKRSSAAPTLNSSQTILNRFTFQNGLPILWEQKRGKDDSWGKKEALRYDSLQRIKSLYHYEQNRLEDITTYTYDDHNRIVTEKRVPFTINIKDSPTLHKQYYYDDSLHSTLVTDLLRDSTAYPFTDSCQFTSQYDAQGRLICVEGEHLGYYNPYPNRCCSISTPVSKVTFKYDDHGSLTEKSFYSGDSMTVIYSLTWEYKYDDKGNWVKCKQYEDDHILYVTKRAIVYR